MKKASLLLAFFFALFSCQTLQQGQEMSYSAVSNDVPLASGTYYIVNNGLALEPNNAMPGQNVFLKPFNKSGMQKWIVTKKVSGKTVNYTIRLAGETDGLWFQGYPVKDHTPIIGTAAGANVSYKIVPVPDSKTAWLIKSNRYNGDVMQSFVFSSELSTEIRFNPAEPENSKFRWEFVKE